MSKVIIPAAGLGTRFLPYTKSIPKEMLPLLNKPAIEYIVQEGLSSNVKQFLFITSKGKESLAHYFNACADLNTLLKARKQEHLISSITDIIQEAQCTYIQQPEPLGLGHALLMARHLIAAGEYFGVALPDDIIVGAQPGLAQLMRIAEQEQASVVAVQEVPAEDISAYGVIAIKKQINSRLFQVESLVEKPAPQDAPPNLAIIGRYVLSQKIFKALDEVVAPKGTELQLTDGINRMLSHDEKVFAYKVEGTRYDVGTPVGWIKAILELAVHHPQFGPSIKDFIAKLPLQTS